MARKTKKVKKSAKAARKGKKAAKTARKSARKPARRKAASRKTAKRAPAKVAASKKTPAKKAPAARKAAFPRVPAAAASPIGEVYGAGSWKEEELSASGLEVDAPELEAELGKPEVGETEEEDGEW